MHTLVSGFNCAPSHELEIFLVHTGGGGCIIYLKKTASESRSAQTLEPKHFATQLRHITWAVGSLSTLEGRGWLIVVHGTCDMATTYFPYWVKYSSKQHLRGCLVKF